MKIAFDFQVFSIQRFGGISRYFRDLADGLDAASPGSVRVVSPLHVNSYLESAAAKVVGFRIPEIKYSRRVVRALNLLASKPILDSYSPDVLHETYYSVSTVRCDCPRIVTVFDMINEKFPAMFKDNRITLEKRISIDRADRLICISEQTKSDLIECFDVDPAKISVVYLGHSGFPSTTVDAAVPEGAPYVLYVGNREGYKNFVPFARAFAASSSMASMRVVCFGGGRWTSEELALIASCRFAEGQILQINGDDSMLAALYRSAALFVYPSLYEGFGIPPLEAMSNNCPVACSNASSIPEVVGDAAAYFDPTDLDSMRDAMEKVLCDSDVRRDLIAAGIERVKQFTWEKCARETMDVYKSVT